MTPRTETFLILLVLTNFFFLGSNRLASYIRTIAIQGILLGFLTVSLHYDHLGTRIFIIALVNTLLKSVLFPWLLFKTIEKVKIHQEINPIVNYTVSVLMGAVMFGLALWLVAHLTTLTIPFPPFIVSIAFFTIMVGFFLMISRHKAITQVIGYLVIENGIYLFGITFLQEAPLLVELGVLLDLFVGIFVMQIIMHHIQREFDSLNVTHLSNLKDWET